MTMLELQRNFWPIDQSMWLIILAQWRYRLILLNIFRTPEKNPWAVSWACSIMLSDKVWERRQFFRTDCHLWLSQTCYNQLCHRSLSCTFCYMQRGGLGVFFLFLKFWYLSPEKQKAPKSSNHLKNTKSVKIQFSFTQEALGLFFALCYGSDWVRNGASWPFKQWMYSRVLSYPLVVTIWVIFSDSTQRIQLCREAETLSLEP